MSSDWVTWRDECWGNADAIDNDEVCSAISTRAYYAAWNANIYGLDFDQCPEDEHWDVDISPFESSRFMKDGHIHRSAHKAMKKVLNSKDYKSLKMGHIKKKDLEDMYNKLDNRLNKNYKKSTKKSKNSLLKAHNNGLQKFTLERDEADDVTDTETYEPCIEHYMDSYLNSDEVQTALHVKPTEWEMCSDKVWYAWPDSDFDRHIEPFYTQIVQKYVTKLGLTLTVYSGDDDSVCGLQGTQYWLERWGQNVNSDVEWEEWSDDDNQLGGYYTQYLDDNDNVGLHFLTVRSAGHMVPTTQPKRALALLNKYLYEFRVSDD